MAVPTPHFLLFSEAAGGHQQTDQWRFALETVDGQRRIVAMDREPGTDGGRLELLAVVRGLEAIDGPARVTLITRSKYVSRGLRQGLNQWRALNWRWERFGRLVPIRDHDLWKRVDRALQFHQVDCRVWRFDAPHASECSEAGVCPGRRAEPSDQGETKCRASRSRARGARRRGRRWTVANGRRHAGHAALAAN